MNTEDWNAPGIYSPVKYPHKGPRDRQELNLTEVAILRRLAKKERMIDIAAALGLNKDYPRACRQRLREAFGVETDEELLRHPNVLRQIKED